MRTELRPPDVPVTPGEVTIIEIEIANTADVIDGVTARVEGLDPSWVYLPLPVLSLFPESTGTLPVHVRFPPTTVAERFGTGRGSITRGVPATDGNLSGANIPLTPRLVSVNFTASPAGTNIALTTAGGTPVASGATSPLTGAVETQFPLTWTATATDFVSQSDTIALTPPAGGSFGLATLSVTIPPITLVAVPPTTTTTTIPPTTTTTTTTQPTTETT